MDDLTQRLVRSLYEVMYDLHRVYGSSTGPYPGVGGQVITTWCHVKDPYDENDEARLDRADAVLRDAMYQLEREGIDILLDD